MLVHPVIPGSGTRSWIVLGDDDVPVVLVDRFLAYLTDIGPIAEHSEGICPRPQELLGVHQLPFPGLARGPAGATKLSSYRAGSLWG
jgi:hypothetical protein